MNRNYDMKDAAQEENMKNILTVKMNRNSGVKMLLRKKI